MTLPSSIVGYPIQIPDVPTVYRGSPFEWELHLGTDMSGYGTAWASSLRQSLDSQNSVDFDVDDSHVADGYIVLTLTAVQTLAMERGRANYGFDVVATGGTETPFFVFRGTVSVDGRFTNG